MTTEKRGGLEAWAMWMAERLRAVRARLGKMPVDDTRELWELNSERLWLEETMAKERHA